MSKTAGEVRMVQFTAAFRDRMRRKLARYAEIDKARATSTARVVVDKKDDQLSVASVPGAGFAWSSDEKGPSPLAYFLSSLALCQCVHYAEHAAAEGVHLDGLRFEVEGTFTVSHPRSFEEILYTVRIESPEDLESIRKLADTAASDCFVTQTLLKACRVERRLFVNGIER